ncbi:alpha/beta hydrolase [Kribbella sp. NPDC056861]|uniref:alpha/beta hydrolase n=1 Tax=Kribbella sp. NPDC056861 TaxID=3154857 RepID=UPI003418CBB9
MTPETVVYSEPVGGGRLELDLWLPTGNGPWATIIYLHGGGWRRGSRRDVLPVFSESPLYPRLVGEGFAVAAVDYRLSGEARYPAPLDDVRAAVQWVREHDALDADRIVLWGESAGAHLALLAALDGGDVAGVVAWFPPTDLLGLPADLVAAGGEADLSPDSREAQLLGVPAQDDPELARAASPVTFAHRGAPPVLLLHGSADDLVPPAQSIRLAEALRGAGGQVELELVEGAKHLWVGAPDPAALVDRSLAFVRTLVSCEPSR